MRPGEPRAGSGPSRAGSSPADRPEPVARRWPFVIAVVTAIAVAAALPAPARAVIVVACPDCGGLPAWLYAVLAVVGILIAMGIFWIAQRLSARATTGRQWRFMYVGSLVILTVCFVLGVRALVVLLGGT